MRYFAFAAASLAGLHLLVMAGAGLLLITTDWRVLECFDGTEPGCDEPPRDTGLSALDATTWVLGSLAAAAALAALVLVLRQRRVATVLALSAASVILVQTLWRV